MTVYMTGELAGIIGKSFSDKLSDYVKSALQEPTPEFGDRVYNFLLGPHIEILSKVPEAYLTYTDRISIRVSTPLATHTISIRFSQPKPWLHSVQGDSHVFGGKLTYVMYTDRVHKLGPAHLWDEDLYDELTTIATTNTELVLMERRAKDNMAILIRSNRTLRQFVKAFPPAKAFVPQHILAKLAGEPRARVGNTKNVDIELLTGVIALLRMNGHIQ